MNIGDYPNLYLDTRFSKGIILLLLIYIYSHNRVFNNVDKYKKKCVTAPIMQLRCAIYFGR